MIIDAHLHIFPRFVGAPHGLGFVSRRYGRVRNAEGKEVQVLPPSFEQTNSTPEVALAYMDMVGVDKAILTQGPFSGLHDDYVARAVGCWPDRFAGLAMYTPVNAGRAADVLERAMTEHGFIGIKVEVPGTRQLDPTFTLTGDAQMRVWERCARLNGLLMLHLDRGAQQCIDVQRVVDAFPRLPIVICHLGLPPTDGWRDQVRLANHEHVYLDLSALPFLYRNAEEYPYPTAQQALEWAVRAVGAEKLLWGTDYPTVLMYDTYGQLLSFVKDHCAFLTEDERAAILGRNAERLLERVRR